MEKFEAMAAQTKPSNKEIRPSCIIAHDLEPVLNPLRELAKKLRYYLDMGLGKVAQSPRSVVFQGGFGGGPSTTQRAASSGGGRDHGRSNLGKTFQEAITTKIDNYIRTTFHIAQHRHF